MEKVNIFFLHGFLGRPEDWQPLISQLPVLLNTNIYLVDYFQHKALNPSVPLGEWGHAFNEFVAKKEGTRNILVGYSLGGRLALQAVAQGAELSSNLTSKLWSNAVLISTNPGFSEAMKDIDLASAERSKRWLKDVHWANKFSTYDWQLLLKDWNSQAVFGNSKSEPLRKENNYSRDVLSLALTNWSLAKQENMREMLKASATNIAWIVGANDKKFVEISRALSCEIPKLIVKVVPKSAHRVLFDQPKALAEIIQNIIGLNK